MSAWKIFVGCAIALSIQVAPQVAQADDGLRIVNAILAYCSKVDPGDAAKFVALKKLIHSSTQKTAENDAVDDSVYTSLGKLDKGAVAATCAAALKN